jgi:poly(hydroxyalkanoate) depolymerase family esterase
LIMNWFPKVDMAKATRLTRAGQLKEAMDVLMARASADPSPSGSGGLLGKLGLGRLRALRHPVPESARPSPKDAQFLALSFSNAAGTRPYKLYVPASYSGSALPLVVMLHGCTQSPDDFAAGTRMNELAEAHGFLVAYPGQTRAGNASKCWNWFNDGDQQRERGEPSLIAGITRQIMADWSVDPARIFVAGLSAGGAQAAIMGSTYPDLYAAIGVHSGLACGAARDMLSGLSAMRQGSSAPIMRSTPVPTIVFHGDKDTTVAPINGDQVIAQAGAGLSLTTCATDGRSPAGMRYTRRVQSDRHGRVMLEQWVLHGVGHAWSGGSTAGSFTDPEGPDASEAMVQFFLRA